MKNLFYIIVGTIFGFILIKGEVISWFRIQEMFRFESFHMYGVIGSAVAVGLVSVQIIRRFGIRAVDGSEINLAPKPKAYKAQLFGGIIFGLGWALTGACPGPQYTLIGAGITVMAVVLLGGILGTFAYGLVKDKLPH